MNPTLSGLALITIAALGALALVRGFFGPFVAGLTDTISGAPGQGKAFDVGSVTGGGPAAGQGALATSPLAAAQQAIATQAARIQR